MPYGRALLLGLLAGLVAGCANAPSLRPSDWLEHFRAAQQSPEANFIEFDVAVFAGEGVRV